MAKFSKLIQNRKMQLIIIVLVTLLAYLNIFQNSFAWDDRDFFVDWPQIKSESNLPAYLSFLDLLKGDLPLHQRGVYRPLRSVYYFASYTLWGGNTFGYHLQTIIIYILIVLLIYSITEIITKKTSAAFIVSLLFAVHPIHTESITSMTASMDTLGILFMFLSFYLYLKIKNKEIKKNRYLLGSVLYAFFGIFTYEATAVLPLIIILYDLCTSHFSVKKILPRIYRYKYFLLAIIVYLLVRFVILGIGNRADFFGENYVIVANQARAGFPEIIKEYLLWLIWPVNLTVSHTAPTNFLSVFLLYLNKIDHSGKLLNMAGDMAFLFPVIYIFLFIGFSYLVFKKHPLFFFGTAWFVLTLLPISNIVPQGAVLAERFLFIPSFGFIFTLGLIFYYLFSNLYRKHKYKPLAYILLSCVFLVAGFYMYQTINRNAAWRNEKTIWESAIKVEPESYRPYAALATVYIGTEQYNMAEKLFVKSLELNPDDISTISNLGLVYEKEGATDKAIAQYLKASKQTPGNSIYHIYLGNVYLKQNNYNQAEEEYKKALKIKKNNPIILSYIGNVYYNQQKYAQALDFYHQALALDSTSETLLYLIGSTYLKQEKYDLAIESLNKSLESNPKQPKIYLLLTDAYKQKKAMQKAKVILEKGIQETNDPEIKKQLKTLELTIY